VPSVNTNIIYKTSSGKILRKIIGDTSAIVLNTGESVVQANIEDIEDVMIDTATGIPIQNQNFFSGTFNSAGYVLSSLPNPTTVVFEAATYTVTTGTITLGLEFEGNYFVDLYADGYNNARFFFYYDGIAGM